MTFDLSSRLFHQHLVNVGRLTAVEAAARHLKDQSEISSIPISRTQNASKIDAAAAREKFSFQNIGQMEDRCESERSILLTLLSF